MPDNNLTPLDPSGQTGTPAPATGLDQTVNQQASGGQSDVVTREEFEAFKAEQARFLQSQTGKLEARITKKIAQAQSIGVQLTPQQAQKMVELEDKEGQSGSTQIPGAPAQVPATVQPTASDPLTQKALEFAVADGRPQPDDVSLDAYRIMAKENIRITVEDPEAKDIGGATPYEFLKSVESAVAKKKERIATEQNPNPGLVPGMVSGAPGGKPVYADWDASKTLEHALKAQKLKI